MKGLFQSWMPLYSIKAWGRFYGPYPFGYFYPGFPYAKGYAIYQRRPTLHGIICIKERYYQPSGEPSNVQLGWRGWFASGVKKWQGLTDDEKKNYSTYTYPLQMSGYNKFLHYYLNDNVFALVFQRSDSTIRKTFDGDTIKLGDAINYLEIRPDGEIILHGTARVTRHLLIDPARLKLPAADFPGHSFEGLFYTLDFDKASVESAHIQEHVPFRWDPSVDIIIEVRWLHDSVDSGKVVWGIEYKSIKAGEVVAGAGTKITKLSAGNHTAEQVVSTFFTDKILASNLESHDTLAVRFYRDTDDAADTLNEDARVLNVCFHFIQNKLGQAT